MESAPRAERHQKLHVASAHNAEPEHPTVQEERSAGAKRRIAHSAPASRPRGKNQPGYKRRDGEPIVDPAPSEVRRRGNQRDPAHASDENGGGVSFPKCQSEPSPS